MPRRDPETPWRPGSAPAALREAPQPPRSVVRRITALLATFRWGGSHTVTELARLTGLPVSTTHRLTAELAAWQILQREPDGRYRVGPTLQLLGAQGDDGPTPALLDSAPCVLTDLTEATRRRARLGVLLDGRVAYVEKRVGSEPVTPFSPGTTLPAHATALGKALLAFAAIGAPPAGQHLTAYTAQTLTTPERLGRALGIVRLTRIAVADGELVPGDCAVATPVFGSGGTVVAALELEVRPIPGELELSKAILMVAASGLARELTARRAASGTGREARRPGRGRADAFESFHSVGTA